MCLSARSGAPELLLGANTQLERPAPYLRTPSPLAAAQPRGRSHGRGALAQRRVSRHDVPQDRGLPGPDHASPYPHPCKTRTRATTQSPLAADCGCACLRRPIPMRRARPRSRPSAGRIGMCDAIEIERRLVGEQLGTRSQGDGARGTYSPITTTQRGVLIVGEMVSLHGGM